MPSNSELIFDSYCILTGASPLYQQSWMCDKTRNGVVAITNARMSCRCRQCRNDGRLRQLRWQGRTGYNADDNNDNATDDDVSNDGNNATGNDLDDDSHGAMGNDVDHYGTGAAYDDIDNDCDGATGDKVGDDGDSVKLSSPSMRRCHHRCRNGVVALIVMALLTSLMHRHLAVVDNDGNNVTRNNDNVNFDNATDFAVVAMVLLPLLQCRCYRL